MSCSWLLRPSIEFYWDGDFTILPNFWPDGCIIYEFSAFESYLRMSIVFAAPRNGRSFSSFSCLFFASSYDAFSSLIFCFKYTALRTMKNAWMKPRTRNIIQSSPKLVRLHSDCTDRKNAITMAIVIVKAPPNRKYILNYHWPSCAITITF